MAPPCVYTYDLSMSLFLYSQMLVGTRSSSSAVPSKPEKTKKDPLAFLNIFTLSSTSTILDRASASSASSLNVWNLKTTILTFTVFHSNLRWEKLLEGVEDATVGHHHRCVNLHLLSTLPHCDACRGDGREAVSLPRLASAWPLTASYRKPPPSR